MRAIHADGIPGTFTSYVGMLGRKRRGLPQGKPMPVIERTAFGCVVEPDWLEAYCESIGLPVGETLPPLALQLAASPLHLGILSDRRFPFPALGLLHVSQRVVQPKPIPRGARLTLRAYTAPADPSPRGQRFKLVTDVSLDGAHVQRAETLALAPSGKSQGGGGPKDKEEEADLGPVRYTGELVAPADIGRRYAAIAGDYNPIHQNALLARPFGFKRAIVHGTWTVGRALAMAGLPTTEGFDLYMRFRKPVLLPSRLGVTAFRVGDVDHVRVRSADGATMHTEIEVKPA